jgi:hypothetical protein
MTELINTFIAVLAAHFWLAPAAPIPWKQTLPEVKAGTAASGGAGIETGSAPNTRVSTELVLKANQLQDLSDLVPELLRAAAGQEIGFTVRVAIKGKDRPKDAVVRAINELLKQVDGGFEVV